MTGKTKALLRENNQRELALHPESQAGMTDIVVYLRVQNISEQLQEEVRRDILSMLLDAQERGETMEQVIGSDYKQFCDEIVSALPPRTWRERGKETLEILFLTSGIMTVLWFVKALIWALTQQGSVSYLPLTVGEMISCVVVIGVAWLLVYYIGKTAFEKKEPKWGKVTTFLVTWVGMVAVLSVIFLPTLLLKEPAVMVWLPAAVIGIVVLFLGYFWLQHGKR